MNPFNTLTPEQQLQVLIVRIDIVLEWIGYVLRIAIPTVLLVTMLVIITMKLRRRHRRSHAER